MKRIALVPSPISMLGAFMIVLTTGCAAPTPETAEFDQQAIEAEVSDWLDVFWATWSEGGEAFDRGMAFYDDGPDFTYAAEGSLWRSHDAAVDAFRPAFENVSQQTMTFEQTSITVLAQDLVYTAYQGTYAQTYADGTTSEATPFAFTALLVRDNGVWKIRFGHESEPPKQ